MFKMAVLPVAAPNARHFVIFIVFCSKMSAMRASTGNSICKSVRIFIKLCCDPNKIIWL